MSTDSSQLNAIATHWSLIRAAHIASKPEEAATARQVLVLRYARATRRCGELREKVMMLMN